MKRDLSQAALAHALEVTTSTVRWWQKQRCPFTAKGRWLKFNLDEVNAWRAKRASQRERKSAGLRQALLRKANADARLAEVRLERRRSEYVRADLAVIAWDLIRANASSRLTRLVDEIATDVHALGTDTTIPAVKVTIDRRVYAALMDLDAFELPDRRGVVESRT